MLRRFTLQGNLCLTNLNLDKMKNLGLFRRFEMKLINIKIFCKDQLFGLTLFARNAFKFFIYNYNHNYIESLQYPDF